MRFALGCPFEVSSHFVLEHNNTYTGTGSPGRDRHPSHGLPWLGERFPAPLFPLVRVRSCVRFGLPVVLLVLLLCSLRRVRSCSVPARFRSVLFPLFVRLRLQVFSRSCEAMA